MGFESPDRGESASNEQLTPRTNRRDVLKTTGALATLGAGALAGCTGDGQDGGSGSPDGSSGGDGGTTGSGSQNYTTLKLGLPPGGTIQLMLDHLGDDLESNLNNAGYTHEFTRSHGNATQYAAGKLDAFLGGPIEMAFIGSQQQVESVVYGQAVEAGGYVLTYDGSPYTVEETGGPEASIQKLVEENAAYGTSGFGGGSAPVYSLLYSKRFDLTFTEDEQDFKVQVVDLGALPKQLANEHLAMAQSSPYLPGFMAQLMPELTMVPVFDTYAQLEEIGYAGVNVGGYSVRRGKWQEHRAGFEAFINSMDSAHQWLVNNPDEAKQMDSFADIMGYDDSKQAEFVLDYSVKGDFSAYDEKYHQFNAAHDGTLTSNAVFGDNWVSLHEETLNELANLGIIAGDWSDYVSFAPLA